MPEKTLIINTLILLFIYVSIFISYCYKQYYDIKGVTIFLKQKRYVTNLHVCNRLWIFRNIISLIT